MRGRSMTSLVFQFVRRPLLGVAWPRRWPSSALLRKRKLTRMRPFGAPRLPDSRTQDLDAYVSLSMAGLGCAKARVGQVTDGLVLLEQAVALDASAEPRITHT